MALNQNISMRVKQKHASQTDWEKAVNFTPLAGEIIIYDGASGSNPRIKVGDGVTKVTALPFVDSVVAAGGLNLYGPDDDVSLTWGGTFEVPYISVSGDRIVEVGMREITLPEEPDFEPTTTTTSVTYVTSAGTLPTLGFAKSGTALDITWNPGTLPTYETKTVVDSVS